MKPEGVGEAGSETSGANFCSAVPLGSSKVDKFGKEALNWGQERHKVVSLRAFIRIYFVVIKDIRGLS